MSVSHEQRFPSSGGNGYLGSLEGFVPVTHPLYFAIGDAEAVQAGVISAVPTVLGSYLSNVRATGLNWDQALDHTGAMELTLKHLAVKKRSI
jgi:hypothetical protein